MPKNLLLSLLLLLFYPVFLTGQTCAIKADSIICLGNSASFDLDSNSGSPITYDWNFGDGTTSNKAAPTHLYVTAGNFQIRAIMNYANMKTCTAFFKLRVYYVPIAKYLIDSNSEFCFSHNEICLYDQSTRSKDNIPFNKRIILWGDGAASLDADFTNNYFCHTYKSWGDFVIDMEITDNKTCNKKFFKTITIKPPVKAKIIIDTISTNCDTMLCNFSADKTGNGTGVKYTWRFQSNQSTVIGDTIYKIYDKTLNEKVTLIATDTTGCSDSVSIPFDVYIFSAKKISHTVVSYCATDNLFKFDRPNYPGLIKYTWLVTDSTKKPVYDAIWTKDAFTDNLSVGKCGKYYVKLLLRFDNCLKIAGPDSVEVLGPKLDLIVRNQYQCEPNDKPVLFCEDLCLYNSTHIKRLYDFGDKTAPQCTTDSKKGILPNSNCNFSRDANPRHKYTSYDCYEASVYIEDTVNGCYDSAKAIISIAKPDARRDTLSGRKGFYTLPDNYYQCYNKNISFKYDQILPAKPCRPLHMWVNFDSASPVSQWQREDTLLQTGKWDSTTFRFLNIYNESFDSLGFVTVGFIAMNGYDKYYVTCDSFVAQPKYCYDTTWLHLRFSGGNPDFNYIQNQNCQPSLMTVYPKDSIQDSIVLSVWNFGKDTTITDSIDASGYIPSRSHQFNKPGPYAVTHTLVNYHGCSYSKTRYIFVNHFSDFTVDTVVCVGAHVQFDDSVFYWDQIQTAGLGGSVDSLWHSRRANHRMIWDFGDGNSSLKFDPIHVYTSPGIYSIKLITIDSLGCADTLTKNNYIHVIQIKSDFYTEKDKYLCGEYVHFIDSSYDLIDSVLMGQKFLPPARKYTWTWGDGKRSSNLPNPFHNFTSYGWVDVKLEISNSLGCRDSITKKVYLKGPVASFDIVSDSAGCVPFTVHLRNTSLDTTCSNYIWLLGDSAHTVISRDTNDDVIFTYTKPGIYEIYLVGQDSVFNPTTGNKYFCTSIFPDTNIPPGNRKRVIVQPYPPVSIFAPDTVCPNVLFDIEDRSDKAYSFFNTDFDDGNKVNYTTKKYTYSYSKTGDFIIRHYPDYIPTFPYKRCVDSTEKPIHVVDIHADFDTLLLAKFNGAEYQFLDRSRNAVKYHWDFGQPNTGSNNNSNDKDPKHNFGGDSGMYQVCLVAFSPEGCTDTACKNIYNPITRKLIIPNAYTNDGDSINDAFDIEIIGEDYYKLYIYTQWGELVFVGEQDGQDNDGINWNGHNFNTGLENPTGTYYFVFEYHFIGDEKHEWVKGFITMMRENK